MKVQNKATADLLAALGAASLSDKSPGRGFKELLGGILKGGERPGAQVPEAKPQQKPKAEEPDAAAAMAAAAQAQQPAQPMETAEPDGEPVAGAVAGGISLLQVAVPPPQTPQEALPQAAEQTAGGDILSMELTVEGEQTAGQVPVSPMPGSGQSGSDTAGTDRFGAMLNQAQQQLQAIAGPPEAIVDNSAEAAAEGAGEAPEEGEIPVPEAAEPGEEQAAEEPGAEGETSPQTKTDSSPQIRNRTDPRMTDQKPLNQMPERDRAVMEMKERTGLPEHKQEKEPEPAAAAAESAPEPVRQEAVRQPEPERPRQPVRTGEQMEQIRVQVEKNLEQDKTVFRMQLQPEELGKVDVRMVLESGRLALEIIAASPKAAELLRAQAEGLVQSLRTQNLEVQTVNVVTESETAGGHMNGAFNMLNGQARQGGEAGGNAGVHGRSGQPGGEEPGETEEPRSPEALLDYAI